MRAYILFLLYCSISLSFGDVPMGYFSFNKMMIEAFMKEGGDTCDWYLQEVDGICDPFVKIYVNGHVDRTTDVEKNTNTKIYTSKYRTEKIPKDSKITFEMWDDDSPFSPDLLLRKTLSIDELTKDFWKEMKAGYSGIPFPKHGQDNFITLYDTKWEDA